jgi:hypothetical protein
MKKSCVGSTPFRTLGRYWLAVMADVQFGQPPGTAYHPEQGIDSFVDTFPASPIITFEMGE